MAKASWNLPGRKLVGKRVAASAILRRHSKAKTLAEMQEAGQSELILVPDVEGMRLDKFLAERLPDVSRSQLRLWFEAGRITVNGERVKTGLKTSGLQEVHIVFPEYEPAEHLVAVPMDLDIRYEDEYLLVVNKPQGLVVHPAPGHYNDTLVNGLLHRYGNTLSDWNGGFRPGIVHRIDKDTSGLLLVVKDVAVHAKLAEALRKHEIVRSYDALVHGHLQAARGTIDVPIARSRTDRKRMAPDPAGRNAVTHFELQEILRSMSYVKLNLETGRTHQIRVHMKYIGHPVVGDRLYAPRGENYGLKGQALHAGRLEFVHPVSGEKIVVEAELPDYFVELLKERA